MKKLLYILLILFFVLIIRANADVIFEELFNDATEPWGHDGDPFTVSGSDDMSISTTYKKEGASSVKVYLNYDTSLTPYRTELVKNTTTNVNKYYTIGNTYWYAFSIYMSSTDYVTNVGNDIIWQFHGVPDDGEDYRSPMVVLSITNDDYLFNVRGDADAIYTAFDRNVEYATELGSVTLNEWTDFVIQIRWDYTATTTGYVNVWRDGVLEIEDEGANCFNDDVGPYLKFGCYHWWWKDNVPTEAKIRVWYMDRILIGNGDSSYLEMAGDAKNIAIGGSETVTFGGSQTITF